MIFRLLRRFAMSHKEAVDAVRHELRLGKIDTLTTYLMQLKTEPFDINKYGQLMQMASPDNPFSKTHIQTIIQNIGSQTDGELNILANCYLRMSQQLRITNNLDQAMEKAQKSIALLTQMKNPYPPEQASLFLHMSQILLVKNQVSTAMKYLQDSRSIMKSCLSEEKNVGRIEKQILAKILNRLIQAYVMNSEMQKAVEMADQGFQIWKGLESKEEFEMNRYILFLHRINIISNLQPQEKDILNKELDKLYQKIHAKPDLIFIYLGGILSMCRREKLDGNQQQKKRLLQKFDNILKESKVAEEYPQNCEPMLRMRDEINKDKEGEPKIAKQ